MEPHKHKLKHFFGATKVVINFQYAKNRRKNLRFYCYFSICKERGLVWDVFKNNFVALSESFLADSKVSKFSQIARKSTILFGNTKQNREKITIFEIINFKIRHNSNLKSGTAPKNSTAFTISMIVTIIIISMKLVLISV